MNEYSSELYGSLMLCGAFGWNQHCDGSKIVIILGVRIQKGASSFLGDSLQDLPGFSEDNNFCQELVNIIIISTTTTTTTGSRGISVSIESGYGLNDWANEVRSPAVAKDFSSSLCVQTGSGAHTAPVQWVQGVLSPGVKRGRSVTLTTHPHLVPRSRMSRSYTSSPPSACMACSGTALLLLLQLLLLLIL
jgi:hypothetical protein